jgi:hypothetical protein
MTTIPETPVNHQQDAIDLTIKVRQLIQSIDGFTFAGPGRRTQIRTSGSLPDKFLSSTAASCDALPEFSAAAQLTGNEVRQALAFQVAYAPLADELELLAKGIRDTLAEHRSRIGYRALRAYAIAKTFSRPEDRATFLPHLRNMKRDFGRSRVKATDVPVIDPTVPVPIPVKKP